MPYNKSAKTNIKQQNKFGEKTRSNTPKIPRKISETYLHNSALYYLERFSASKNHFKFVMKRKVLRSCMHHTDQDYDACASMVDTLADKFEKSGLLDDNLYTNGLVASMRRKGMSKSAIINKMRVKGIDSDKTALALEKLDSDNSKTQDESERIAAIKLAKKKKIGAYFIPTPNKPEQDIKKSLGVFARAGFSYSIARSVLDCDIDEIEEFFF